jgi:carboxyl-terminal processing protease
MTRPNRILLTISAVLALSAAVAVGLVRDDAGPGRATTSLLGATASADQGPLPDAPALAYRGLGTARAKEAGGDYRLEALPALSFVIKKVTDEYVDPARIDPRAMFVAALDAVERTVAEVMVKGDATGDAVSVTVGTAQRDFDLRTIQSVWSMRVLLQQALGFVQENLVAHQDLREIEYAAANGLLSTLDPHSMVLEPRYFKEMKLQTRGEFGGIGFVIAMREGNLTVVKVLKGTPAQRAGIKARDVITRIEEQSTVNMDLQDAVDRLRGKPQTRVSLTVQRAAWPEARKLTLTREMISVETVPQSKLLAGNVAYLRLAQFSRNSTRDVRAAIVRQRAEAGGELTGLVLDLRGNPGGLLEEAVDLSDLFLTQGVVVKTQKKGSARRSVTEAVPSKDDLASLPVVVLVNNGSASASEIVAGALKNNDRALVVGRQTFGKGSVQQLYDFTESGRPGEEAALKLTVAEYLTPGDVSIQETGISPDVLLLPGRALKDQVNFFAPPRSMGEADLDRHLANPTGKPAAAPGPTRPAEEGPLELRYLLEEDEDQVARALKRDAARASPHGDEALLSAEQIEDEQLDADPDQVKEDFQIRFARELLARAPSPDRQRLLQAATTLVGERRAEEEARLTARLGRLGVDWGLAAAGGVPRPVVTVTPAPGRAARAGETVPFTVTVENRGTGALRRLRAWTSTDKAWFLDRREFVFGAVRPGERRSWTVPLKLARSMDSRRDEVTLHFDDQDGHAPPDVSTTFDVVEVPRPAFAFSVQVDDARGGNGDGLPQRGESFTLRVDVRNVGPGTSGEKTTATLKNLGDEKLFITKGRARLGALKPGEQKSAAMEVELRRGSQSDTLPVRVQVLDEQTGELVSEDLEVAIPAQAGAVAASRGAVAVLVSEALVRGGASPTALPVAVARQGAVLPVTGTIPGFRRVEWAPGRFGFVAQGDVKAAKGRRRSGAIAPVWQREPPRIALAPDPARGAPVVDGDTLKLSGTASLAPTLDPDAALRDVFIYVNQDKVFFRVLPSGAGAASLDFATDLPLKPGQNVVTVVARIDDELLSRRSVVVYRKTPAEVAESAAPRRAPQ